MNDNPTLEQLARIMYTTEGALEAVGNGIKDCLRKKDRPKCAGHDLLIEAHLHSLPKERWSRIEDDLRSAARTLPFRENYVIGDHDTSPFGFRIEGRDKQPTRDCRHGLFGRGGVVLRISAATGVRTNARSRKFSMMSKMWFRRSASGT